MNGYKICRILRGTTATEGILVIIVAGETNGDSFVMANELGVAGFLFKPIDPYKLTVALAAGLDQSRSNVVK
jgi:PleD family two-component response regulator